MDATHPVRVVLLWDSKHARDAYDPYFTGVKNIEASRNGSKSLEGSNDNEDTFRCTINIVPINTLEDDDDNDDTDENYEESSESDNDNDDNDEEDDISTPVNPLSTTVIMAE
ncbi:hypothetical protein M9H77_29985 [Catharanthus roseus]|uniref:Uncharacterized protein n=1 Tax=Catharanthus roseus TaxID=4058 RepID=A0ACB9ZVZ8_CATRO|nr:hypothetical protein M9H77_29985 [Catharanthus roseus]